MGKYEELLERIANALEGIESTLDEMNNNAPDHAGYGYKDIYNIIDTLDTTMVGIKGRMNG